MAGTRKLIPDHRLGTEFYFLFYLTNTGSTAPVVDLTNIPVTVVLDYEDGTARVVLKWLNGGSDGTLINGGLQVQFQKNGLWSATNLKKGTWEVSVSWGIAGGFNDELIYGPMQVLAMPSGSLPTS